ncbi:MAG TPA: hypothetical protein V6D18_18685, partial [Thermosynechococcaceae cyanobacterium]
MSFDKLTGADRDLLEQARLKRLLELVPELQNCLLKIDLEAALIVRPLTALKSHELLDLLPVLTPTIYSVLGCQELKLFRDDILIWSGCTIESDNPSEEADMVATTMIDRSKIDQTVDQVIDQQIDQEIDAVVSKVVESRMSDHSLEERIRDRVRQRLQGFLASSNNGNVAVAIIEATVQPVLEAQPEPEPPTPTLTFKLPRGFAKTVTNRYEQELGKLLPQDDRAAYLDALIA